MTHLTGKALAVVIVVLLAPACDTVGDVPSLDDLRAEYGAVAEGRFEVYDAETDSTLSGAAVLSPAECPPPGAGVPDVCLATDDFEFPEGTGGSVVMVSAGELLAPTLGEEFDVEVGYVSDRHDFASTEGRAVVTGVSAGGAVSAVFWAVVRPQGLYRTSRLVIEGGFSAVPAAP